MPVPSDGCGYIEIQKFQEYCDKLGIAIVLFDSRDFGKGSEILFDGRKESTPDVFYIIYDNDNNHYDLITNLAAAVSLRFFCSFCNKKYTHINSYVCDKICTACFTIPSCVTNLPLILCWDCLREFYGEKCFQNHITPGSLRGKSKKTICKAIRMCTGCYKIVHEVKYKHICGLFYCKQCQSRHLHNQLCFVQPSHNAVVG